MKRLKNNLDEMQEQKLLRIEHNGCWVAFWGLLAVWVVQIVLYPEEWHRFAGEWIVFMALCLYLGIACIRSGIWARRLKPNAKTNLILSAVAGLVAGAIMFVSSYLRYHKLVGSIATGVIVAACCFGLCIAALSLSAHYVKKKQQALEQEPEDEK